MAPSMYAGRLADPWPTHITHFPSLFRSRKSQYPNRAPTMLLLKARMNTSKEGIAHSRTMNLRNCSAIEHRTLLRERRCEERPFVLIHASFRTPRTTTGRL